MDLNHFKEKLLKRKEQLEKELETFTRKNPKLAGDYETKFPQIDKSGVIGMDEEAQETEAYLNSLPIEHSLELQLQQVVKALKRIQQGDFGKCLRCQGRINPKRLEVLPQANFCIECEQKLSQKP
jgi:DnaK suppressor protein